MHVLVAIGEDGRTRGGLSAANTPEGWGAALRRARELHHRARWGVENSGSSGKGFARFLLAQGEAEVREVAPRRAARYRLPAADAVTRTRPLVVRRRATRLLQPDAGIAGVTGALGQRVQALGTPLPQVRGVGPVVAARPLGGLGRVPRVHSAAALAAPAGVAPPTVASGGQRGHRVNPGGNRKLNRAIHIVALTQRRCEPPAQASYAEKRAGGKTARAAMRCPKRRLVDVPFRHLRPACQAPPAPALAIAA